MLSHCAIVLMLAQAPGATAFQEGFAPPAETVAQVQTQAIPTGSVGYTSGSPGADINGDGVIDIFDVIAFINCVNTGAACADLNGDGIIDIFDVQLFIFL